MKMLIASVLSCSALLVCRPVQADPGKIFVVTSYSFDFKNHPEAPEVAQSICGTRCNALSGDLKSYMSPGGWRLIKVKGDEVKIIDIDNPFIDGNCLCVGDEYLVRKEYQDEGINPRGGLPGKGGNP